MLTVSGTTITANSGTTLTNNSAQRFALARLDSTNVLLAYSDATSVHAVVLSISGTTITENTIKLINTPSSSPGGVTCEAFSSTKAIITWFETGADHDGMIVDISGTTITTNTKKTIDNSNSGPSAGEGEVSGYASCLVSATKSIYTFDNLTNYSAYVLTLSGSTFNVGSEATISSSLTGRISCSAFSSSEIATVSRTSSTVYTGEGFTITGGGSDTLTTNGTDTVTVTSTRRIACAAVDGTNILAHFETTSTSAALLTLSSSVTHLWLSTDGAATFTDIGDATWAANVVGGVVVVPGTAYQTIFAAVGTNLYKTINGGTAWTLETAIGYEVDFIDLEKDNTTVFLAKRDAAGTNRASLWDSVGASLSHINTGKSTTGGSTAGGDVV
jgi:hypothetical protein